MVCLEMAEQGGVSVEQVSAEAMPGFTRIRSGMIQERWRLPLTRYQNHISVGEVAMQVSEGTALA